MVHPKKYTMSDGHFEIKASWSLTLRLGGQYVEHDHHAVGINAFVKGSHYWGWGEFDKEVKECPFCY